MNENVGGLSEALPGEYASIAAKLLEALPLIVQETMGGQVRGYAEPLDVAQDVWIEFQHSLSSFKPRSNDVEGDIRGLLSTIVRTNVIDLVRKCDRFITAVEATVFEVAKQDGMTPSRAVAKEQAFATLRDSLAQLDATERGILLRRFDAGQRFAEIARGLGLSEDQVDHGYRRAIKKLRQLLGNSSDFRFVLAQP